MKTIFILAFSFVVFSVCLAEEEVASPSVGPGMAVLEASREDGIKLSEKAKTTIGIKIIKLGSNFQIPSSSLIQERGEFGVYIKNGEWFKFIEIEVLNPSAQELKIKSTKIHLGDEIVVSGVSLLRLAELNLSDTGGDND